MKNQSLRNGGARAAQLDRFLVKTVQMQAIEARVFAVGMPVAALMEKVAGLIVQRLQQIYRPCQVGVLVGPGHNGGDALVVARELHFQGYSVQFFCPFERLKPLTAQHRQYVEHLGISGVSDIAGLYPCDLLIDGLFGFGLVRAIEGDLAAAVERVNQWRLPVVSLDLPSGIQTDTGAVLGVAVQATHTFCLGLWKQAFVEAPALPYLGQPALIDFGLPLADIQAVLGLDPPIQRLTHRTAISTLPLPRPLHAHKYTVGNLLLIAGSRRYVGAARLAAAGAVASGVGMVTLAVPESLQLLLVTALPGILVVGCPETSDGAIADLSPILMETLDRFDAIVCGPGLTAEPRAVVEMVCHCSVPLLLDADGLNIVADQKSAQWLSQRLAPTVMTPHLGEFRRLFPTLVDLSAGEGALQAAYLSQAQVVLKGARVAIATPEGRLWFNPASTPALARGGSGDVLTGLMGGLMAQHLVKVNGDSSETVTTAVMQAVLGAVWWHAQAGLFCVQRRTELGVDPLTLAQELIPTLQSQLNLKPKD